MTLCVKSLRELDATGYTKRTMYLFTATCSPAISGQRPTQQAPWPDPKPAAPNALD